MATKPRHNKEYEVSFILHGFEEAVELTGEMAHSFWVQFKEKKENIIIESHDTTTHVTTTLAYPYHAIISVQAIETPDDEEVEIC